VRVTLSSAEVRMACGRVGFFRAGPAFARPARAVAPPPLRALTARRAAGRLRDFVRAAERTRRCDGRFDAAVARLDFALRLPAVFGLAAFFRVPPLVFLRDLRAALVTAII
jgi:hypothetical protein